MKPYILSILVLALGILGTLPFFMPKNTMWNPTKFQYGLMIFNFLMLLFLIYTFSTVQSPMGWSGLSVYAQLFFSVGFLYEVILSVYAIIALITKNAALLSLMQTLSYGQILFVGIYGFFYWALSTMKLF